jgi:hypothetical protein
MVFCHEARQVWCDISTGMIGLCSIEEPIWSLQALFSRFSYVFRELLYGKVTFWYYISWPSPLLSFFLSLHTCLYTFEWSCIIPLTILFTKSGIIISNNLLRRSISTLQILMHIVYVKGRGFGDAYETDLILGTLDSG